MSVKLMWSAMTVKAGSPTAKLILLKLADNANDKGECWPSLKNIAEHCEVSQKTVITNIKKLEELGYVKKINRFNDKGKTSNLYVITLTGSEPVEGNSSTEPCEKTSTTHVKKRKEPSEKTSTTPCEKSSHESVSSESVKEPEKTKAISTEEKIVNLYNEILADSKNQYHLPFVKVITEKRKKALKKFWALIDKDINRVESYFNWFISNAEHHRWIFGDNDRCWKADIEYICRDETFAKATENRLTDWRAAA
tara:strand:+ start:5249 stop:6004 length:756 start_codon:yes stop_codon:yes gene_type:complete